MTVDILTSLALSIIANAEGVNKTVSEKTGCAIASVAIFGFVTLVYIAITVVYYSCKFKQLMDTPELENTTKCKKIKSCLKEYGKGILIALGGLFYFFGDNFSPLVNKYKEELHCDQDCIFRTQTVGIVVLGLATVTYLPILIDPRVPNKQDKKNKIPGSLLLVPKITNLDLVYTTIERVAVKDCDKVMVGSWTYWGIYIFVFSVTSVIQSYKSHKKKKKKVQTLHMQYKKHTEEPDEQTTLLETQERTEEPNEHATVLETEEHTESNQVYYSLCAIIPGILISLFAASYILADNRLPLACTGSAKDIYVRNIVWVGLWSFAFFNLAVFGVWYMCKRWWYTCKNW